MDDLHKLAPTPETLLDEPIHARNCQRFLLGLDNTTGRDCTCFVGRYADAWAKDRKRLEAAEKDTCPCGGRTAVPHNPWCQRMWHDIAALAGEGERRQRAGSLQVHEARPQDKRSEDT